MLIMIMTTTMTACDNDDSYHSDWVRADDDNDDDD